MTPKEKWERINNPQTASDYGLSLSKDEMNTFDEGRRMLETINNLCGRGRDNQKACELIKDFGARASETAGRIAANVLNGGS